MRASPPDKPSFRPFLCLTAGALLAALIATKRNPEPALPRAAPTRAHAPAHTEPVPNAAPKPDFNPAPIFSVEESLSLFKLAPGFRIDCVAAEPTVEAPVAMAFDEDGRAWVVEMRSYMPDAEGHGEDTPSGRIIVLDDTDDDGVFDHRSVFLDQLVLPRAVMPCYGGALVLEPPNLYFCRDTNNDGKADTKREVLAGLGGQNPEHAPNGLLYGLDNWIHLSQSEIELRFDGDSAITRPTPNHGQWGITQDERARFYYTPNSEALRADLYPKHYAARNADQRGADGINLLVAKDQAVWPARPTPGVNRGYIKGTLRPDGTLANHTAACGPVIYDASLFPPDCRGNAFVCEPGGFLVRRLTLKETPAGPQAASTYDHAEFLTSTDERFRPVNACVGPDGALYILDMHRGVIQHKTYLTPYLKEQVHARALEKPLDPGRIYRVGPAQETPAPREPLASTYDERLVEFLASPDGWWRRTAQRLLVERRATGVTDALRSMAVSGPTRAARLHALWTLEGIGALAVQDVRRAIEDPDPAVRAAGLRLGEPWLVSHDQTLRQTLRQSLAVLLDDPDRSVRVQAVLSAGQIPGADALSLFERALVTDSEDGVLRGAVISGLSGRTPAFLRKVLATDWMGGSGGRSLVADLCDCVLRSKSLEDRAALVDTIADRATTDPHNPQSAEFILARLRRAQQLDSETARIIELARAPRGWTALAESEGKLGESARESDYYLTWPGKPQVNPPKKLRPLTPREFTRYEAGNALFSGGCAACHAHDGTGIPGQIPPLAGSARAQGNEARSIRILLHGLDGGIETAGGTFNGSMPPAPFSTDEEIAAVLTYIRRAWGNTGDPIDPPRVKKVRDQTATRTQPWTATELDRIK